MSDYINKASTREAFCLDCKGVSYRDCEHADTCHTQKVLTKQPSAEVVPIGEEWERGYTAGQMAERREHEWIPCEERLPEKSGMYLCTCNDGYDNRTTFVKYQKRFSRWDLTGTRSYWKVLAWMPLPEPYQPKERSE